MSDIEKIRQKIEWLKELNEGLYTEGDNSYYEGQDNAYNHILAFIDSLPKDDPLNDPKFCEGFDVGRKVQKIFDEPEDDIPKIEGWIARNKDGSLVFCYHKPHRENSITQEWWGSCDADFRIYDDTIDEQFKDLKWENEPREVELIIRCGTCKGSLQVQETCKENTDSFTSLEEAADEYAISLTPCDQQEELNYFNSFIAGTKWMANQMPMPEDTVIFMKGVEEGRRLEREDRNDDTLPRYYGD